MLLTEFFGKQIKLNSEDKDQKNGQHDLFWYILDHDKLHKDYFLPLAKKIAIRNKNSSLSKESIVDEFMPMVEKGCLEYYKQKKLNGKINKLFPEELRKELCEKLYDYCYENIKKNVYKLGS